MLIGREREEGIVRAFLATAPGAGALVIRGPVGMGKTVLIDECVAGLPPGSSVVRTTGIRSEARLPFAGLVELLYPLLDRLGGIPPAQRSAIEVALAIGDAAPVAPLAVAMATLSLLSSTAEDGSGDPVFVVIDDAQWLDPESRDCVAFAARRAKGRITMILGCRSDDYAWLPAGLDILDLEPLGVHDAELVVQSVAPDLAHHERGAIVRAAEGNPLALSVLPSTVQMSAVGDASGFSQTAHSSDLLHRVFDARIDTLPPSVRRTLLLAAVAATEHSDPLRDALRIEGLEGTIAEAEALRMLRVESTHIRFSHPLIRAAVRGQATPTELSSAHRALAEVTAGEERAWHLAASCQGANDEAADALAAAGRTCDERQAHWAATDAYMRSFDLTSDADLALSRRLSAAEAAQLAGRSAEALRLASVVADTSRDQTEQLRALLVIARIGSDGERTLIQALAHRIVKLAPAGPRLASEALLWTATTQLHDLEISAALTTIELAETLSGVQLPEQRAMAYATLGDRTRARDVLAECRANGRPSLSVGWRHRAVMLEEFDELERDLNVVDQPELLDAGAYFGLPNLRYLRGLVALVRGRFAKANLLLEEAENFGRVTGRTFTGMRAAGHRGRVLAVQGKLDAARELLSPMCDGSEYCPPLIEFTAKSALGFVLLTAGDAAAAATVLRGVGNMVASSGARNTVGVPWSFDLIVALARMGELDEAHKVQRSLEADAHQSGSVSASALALAGAGLLTERCEDSLFEKALAIDETDPRPFEAARIRLLWGTRLHREKRRADARFHLTAAADAFHAMGAAPWETQARQVLGAATGSARRSRPSADPNGGTSLSTQELEIATRAATGATVRLIATELFLSPKTVEWHLSAIYRKLNVQTRVALADALRRLNDSTPG